MLLDRAALYGDNSDKRCYSPSFQKRSGTVPAWKEAAMREVEEAVLDALKGRSKENPLTRSELREITGKRDSRARAVIQSLREQGYRIGSSGRYKGYWIASSPEEYKAIRAELCHKANTINKIVRAMDAHTDGQEEWQIQDI